MNVLSYEVGYAEQRNRLTVAFRYFLALPHLIVSGAWGALANVLALVQWFTILFTGRRNQGIWDLQRGWLAYYARVQGYLTLVYDPYPAFGTESGPAPVRFDISYTPDADRLTNGLRFLWILPAAVIGWIIGIGAAVVVVASWFVIVFTGRHPRGMWELIYKAVRFQLRLQAYGLLMTDTYPSYDDGFGLLPQALPGPAPVRPMMAPPPPMTTAVPPPPPPPPPPPQGP